MKKAIVWSTNTDSNDQVVKLSSVCENSRLFVFHLRDVSYARTISDNSVIFLI